MGCGGGNCGLGQLGFRTELIQANECLGCGRGGSLSRRWAWEECRGAGWLGAEVGGGQGRAGERLS